MAVKPASQLFSELESSNKWDVPVTIQRNNPVPLDSKSIFPSLAALTTYVNSSPVAYAGQIVAVVDGTTHISTAYIINDNGTISEIGTNWGSLPAVPNNNNEGENDGN